jgi:hypothetical protein
MFKGNVGAYSVGIDGTYSKAAHTDTVRMSKESIEFALEADLAGGTPPPLGRPCVYSLFRVPLLAMLHALLCRVDATRTEDAFIGQRLGES